MPSSTAGSAGTLLIIGGYTPDDAPVREGIAGLTTWWWDGGTGIEPAGSANLASPSFVCAHPSAGLLYAVSELPEGIVTTLAVADDGTLTELDRTPTGGAQPCWVTTDPLGRTLLIANYGSGSMAVLALADDGRPTGEPVLVAHQGSGPVAGRQDAPHVHQVVPTADGFVLASDLGTDRIAEYRIDPASPQQQGVTVTRAGSITMPAGSGPRHIALVTGGRAGFVTGELDGTVTVIQHSPERTIRAEAGTDTDGRWSATEQVPCSRQAGAQPSQLMLAGGDRWLLVANRGPDTLAVLDVADGLAIHAEVPTGRQPRYFTLDGDRVLVACQGADAVDVFTLDTATGTLTRDGQLTPTTSSPARSEHLRTPACVLVRH